MSNISKLPEAQDIADGICSRTNPKNELIKTALLGFAKLHVEAALKEVNNVCDNEIEKDFINEQLILNAYPLTLIK